MNMFALETKANGKQYDKIGRFRLVIEIFGSLDDGCSKILRRMKNGTVVIYGDFSEATQAQQEFSQLADFAAELGPLACYGFSCIVDTRDGTINSTIPIQDTRPDDEF